MATSVRDIRAAIADQRSCGPGPLADPVADRSLAALIEGQIVPRLVLAHRQEATTSPTRAADLPGDAFTALVMADDPAPLFAEVDRLLAAGASVEAVMVDVLAPAARLIGSWWEEERCDFVAVTMGLWRLQEVVHALADRAPQGAVRGPLHAVFATFPGDRPDFMTTLAAEHFGSNGWRAERIFPADMAELLAAVAEAPVDLLTLTVDGEAQVAQLPAALVALRSVSCQSRLRILVGGRAIDADAALAAGAGADGIAPGDLREALRVAEALVNSAACGMAFG